MKTLVIPPPTYLPTYLPSSLIRGWFDKITPDEVRKSDHIIVSFDLVLSCVEKQLQIITKLLTIGILDVSVITILTIVDIYQVNILSEQII